MNNVLEFLEIKTKKRIDFPLINETIKLLKRYRIDKYEINYNILRFKPAFSKIVKVEYDKLENYYHINENDSKVSRVSEPKEFISELEEIIKGYRCSVYKLPNIKVPYPELAVKNMIKR